MSLGQPLWSEARTRIRELLARDTPTLRDDKELLKKALVPLSECQMHVPANIGDYTDFYSSRSHATNVGIMFRGLLISYISFWIIIFLFKFSVKKLAIFSKLDSKDLNSQ